MRAIHKYALSTFGGNEPEVKTYEGAKFLTAANQYEEITVWAEVNTLARECIRRLHIVGTGFEVPPDCDYIGTALVDGGGFVFHVYAEREQR